MRIKESIFLLLGLILMAGQTTWAEDYDSVFITELNTGDVWRMKGAYQDGSSEGGQNEKYLYTTISGEPLTLAFNQRGDLYILDSENKNGYSRLWKASVLAPKLPQVVSSTISPFASDMTIDAEDTIYFLGKISDKISFWKLGKGASTPEKILLVPTVNGLHIRSLTAYADGYIYASGQDKFGPKIYRFDSADPNGTWEMFYDGIQSCPVEASQADEYEFSDIRLDSQGNIFVLSSLPMDAGLGFVANPVSIWKINSESTVCEEFFGPQWFPSGGLNIAIGNGNNLYVSGGGRQSAEHTGYVIRVRSEDSGSVPVLWAIYPPKQDSPVNAERANEYNPVGDIATF